MENKILIRMENITKMYKIGNVETVAVNKINLIVNRGEFLSIVGRSGCGKSTLLNIMGGMDSASGGDYYFNSVHINKLRGKKLSAFRNRNVGFIFQSFNLVNEMNIINNVCMPLGYAGVKHKDRIEQAHIMLDKVGLRNKYKNRPAQISGGEQQRVAIARALITKPDILLADEPTGNLDQKNSENIMNLLLELNKDGKTIIMVTHDMEIAQCTDKILCMMDGNIV